MPAAARPATNLKVVDPQGRTHTDINEPGPAVGPRVLEELLGRLTRRLAAGDIVVLAGSLPAGAPSGTYRDWTAACRQAGAKVFLVADGSLLAEGIQAAPYLVKPNRDELSRLAGRPLETVDQLRQAGAALLDAGIRKVVVSLGSPGGLYMTREQTILAEGLPVKVGSTVGAGDSVVAALACAEDRGLSLEEAVVLSNRRRRGQRHVQRHPGRGIQRGPVPDAPGGLALAVTRPGGSGRTGKNQKRPGRTAWGRTVGTHTRGLGGRIEPRWGPDTPCGGDHSPSSSLPCFFHTPYST